jgi:excisionase family DNA binding protein
MSAHAVLTIAQAVEANPWLTERYARRLIHERRIPFHKVGGRVLLDQADLDELIALGRVPAAS